MSQIVFYGRGSNSAVALCLRHCFLAAHLGQQTNVLQRPAKDAKKPEGISPSERG